MAASLINLTKFASKNLKLRHHWLGVHEFKQAPGVGVWQGIWCATVHGVAKSWTWLNDWNELNWVQKYSYQIIFTHIRYKTPCPPLFIKLMSYIETWENHLRMHYISLYLSHREKSQFISHRIFLPCVEACPCKNSNIRTCENTIVFLQSLTYIKQRAWHSVFKKQ